MIYRLLLLFLLGMPFVVVVDAFNVVAAFDAVVVVVVEVVVAAATVNAF